MGDAEAGENAAKMTPLKAGGLKKGGYIQIKGHPCKVSPGAVVTEVSF